MDIFHRLFNYLNYKLEEIDEHSLHSPYLYSLYNECFKPASRLPQFPEIDEIRQKHIHSGTKIIRTDLGTGKSAGSGIPITISDIARKSTLSPKYVRLLCQLCQFFKCRGILELGTSLGLTSAYISASNPESYIYTFEGDTGLLPLTRDTLKHFENIALIEGNIDYTLPAFTNPDKKIHLAFIDANHTYKATISYYRQIRDRFDPSIIVIDDIYWSKGMTQAWLKILENERESLILDLFRLGIIIRGHELPAGSFSLHF